jgi:Putative Actinobacterial Holin-X, holin superfamily III
MDPPAATRPHQRNPESVAGPRTETEWSTLLGRMLEDVSRIMRLELQLLEARIAPSLTGMADRAIAALVLLFAGVIGGSCLLAALILLLHEWMKWWQASAIGGVVAIACGFVAYSVIRRPPAVTETKST